MSEGIEGAAKVAELCGPCECGAPERMVPHYERDRALHDLDDLSMVTAGLRAENERLKAELGEALRSSALMAIDATKVIAGLEAEVARLMAQAAEARGITAEAWHQQNDALRAQGFAAGIEAAARVAEGGKFLTENAPTARFGREAAAAIRREVVPTEKGEWVEPERCRCGRTWDVKGQWCNEVQRTFTLSEVTEAFWYAHAATPRSYALTVAEKRMAAMRDALVGKAE